MPPRWPIPPTFSSRKCQMLSITEWVALIGGLSAAVVALVKVASDAAKTRAEIALIRADLTRNDQLIAETHHQVTPNNGGSLLDSSKRNEDALAALTASVGRLDDSLRHTAADVRGLRRDVGRLADADQQLIEADQRDREAGDRAHVLIHQRLDRLETRPEGTTP